MNHYWIPGVSVAVIRVGRVAWIKGYEKRTAGSAEGVAPATRLQVASLSKFAMRLSLCGRSIRTRSTWTT
jgi:CubicO group peptidase (beta-lactamase class C family)